ncbi:MAG: tetratricopeptide repeat protein [bacterium]
MKIKKKISRKELLRQEDEFVSTTHKVMEWLKDKQNQQILAATIIAVILVVLVGLGIRFNIKSKKENSQKLYTLAMQTYQASVATQSQNQSQPVPSQFKTMEEKYSKALEEFDQVITLYPRSKAAENARFFKLNCLYYLGRYDEVINRAQEYIKKYPNGQFGIQALITIAYSYEQKKELPQACEIFNSILDKHQDYLLRDSIYMDLGRCYEELNDMDKATEAYQQVLINFPQSVFVKEAEKRLEISTAQKSTTQK